MEPMRYDSTVQIGGRIKHTTRYLPVGASPRKRKREDGPTHDYLLPDVAPDPPFFHSGMSSDDFASMENDFAFDEGHPVDTGPREARESVSWFV